MTWNLLRNLKPTFKLFAGSRDVRASALETIVCSLNSLTMYNSHRDEKWKQNICKTIVCLSPSGFVHLSFLKYTALTELKVTWKLNSCFQFLHTPSPVLATDSLVCAGWVSGGLFLQPTLSFCRLLTDDGRSTLHYQDQGRRQGTDYSIHPDFWIPKNVFGFPT